MSEGPRLEIPQERHVSPFGIEVVGADWADGPVQLLLDDEAPTRVRALAGDHRGERVKPVAGKFDVRLDAPGLSPGRHVVVATAVEGDHEARAEAHFELADVPDLEEDGRPTLRWLRRRRHFNARRFPKGLVRPGTRLRALADRDAMREAEETGPAVSPGCNWYPIGPSVVRNGQVLGPGNTYARAPISGRVTDLAIDPNNLQTVYVATAQGGLWKSTNGGVDWEPKSDFEASLACGSVTVDPSVTDAQGRSTRILVGTGEPNNSDSYYGAGVLFSDNGGDTWVQRGATTFARAAFSTIAVDPADNQHLLAATDSGIYESNDEGVNWSLTDAGVFHDLVVDWTNAGGAQAYAGRTGVGVRSRTAGGGWTTLGGGLPTAPARVALAMAPSDSNVIYVAVPNITGSSVTFYRTGDGGGSWTTSGTLAASQLGYNLVLAVHPTDPSILLFGEVRLWRSVDSGGSWSQVSAGSPGIHADQHALGFDPTDGSRVFAGNDGGAWLSTDGGVSWRHRNKDLATLQYFSAAGHGRHEAVMLGGTQDNGAQRYLSHPAWERSALGDGAFCAINSTTNPHRWYETRWYSFPCFRSDSSGARDTWIEKQTGITTNSNWFYPPFKMDPNDSAVLYCGYDRLYRSSDDADSWAPITGVLSAGSNITSIAIAPSNSGIVYVGLRNGRIFSVVLSGTTWTATDISSAPIPAGQISDIAVHPTNPSTVYATTSDLIFSEGAESFAEDHVYRTQDGGGTWTSVSAGLSQANPVNSIVIDPETPQRIFIGADVGIFRSEDGGATWAAWDQGLPNCSVQDLTLFEPQRLLRAATHGRSLWERPVDAANWPLVQLYMRDNELDTGRVTPSPYNVQHPFDDGQWLYWWQSADIKIDSPDPVTNAYAFPGTDIDYLQFEEHQHDSPRRDTWVRVYAQIHVRGNEPATNVRARAFWTDPGAVMPPLPTDFWSAFPDSDPTVASPWRPVAPAETIPSIAPGRPGVAGWKWHVPSSAPEHICMLVAVTSDEDSISVSTLDVGQAVNGSNHVTHKNLHVEEVVPGAVGAGSAIGPYMIELGAFDGRVPIDIRFNTLGLPPGVAFHIVLPPFELTAEPKQAFHGVEEGGEVPPSLHEIERFGGPPIEFDWNRVFVLKTGKPDHGSKDGRPGFYGLRPTVGRFAAAFTVTLPDARIERPMTFHIEQWAEDELAGGSSYELRPAKSRGKSGAG